MNPQAPRVGNETWRECVERVAREQGLAKECLDWFDTDNDRLTDPGYAAWCALYEWDCLE